MNIQQITKSLKDISARGWTESMRTGDTGIGYTLETLLGIKENNDAGADIHGVGELKAKRKGTGSKTTLFTCSPIWIERKAQVIEDYGWIDEGKNRINFYTTLFGNKYNSHNLKLEIEQETMVFIDGDGKRLGEWLFDDLKIKLDNKLKNLLLVTADTKRQSGKTYFHYNKAQYFTDYSSDKFFDMIRNGKIVIEPRLHISRDSGRIRDSGVAVRISEKNMLDFYRNRQVIL